MFTEIRLAQPETDLPAIVDLVNTVEPEPITLAEVQRWFDYMPPGRISHRIVAVQGGVIGYGVVVHEAWAPALHFYVWVVVDPQWRGQGMGSALYADCENFLRAQGATTLTSEVRDNDSAALHFADQRGFVIDRHLFESTLDLTTFDETPYLAVRDALQSAGLRFFSLVDLANSREIRLKLYELNRATGLDIPGADDTFMSFADFEQWICGAEWFCPDGQIIAADGDTWVGLAAVRLHQPTQGAYNLMTGVLRPYRGRKIALALKVEAIQYARNNGMRYVRTNNDSFNGPMLAINRKLGYQPLPGKYRMTHSI